MFKKLNWEGYSDEERNSSIDKVKKAITSSGGYIVNFNLSSDLAINLSIEIEERKIIALHQYLSQHVKITDIEASLASHSSLSTSSTKEWLIFLNLSFSKGKGDFKVNIPKVPG